MSEERKAFKDLVPLSSDTLKFLRKFRQKDDHGKDIQNPSLNRNLVAVYTALSEINASDYQCWSQTYISSKSLVKEDTIGECLALMESWQMIRRVRQYNRRGHRSSDKIELLGVTLTHLMRVRAETLNPTTGSRTALNPVDPARSTGAQKRGVEEKAVRSELSKSKPSNQSEPGGALPSEGSKAIPKPSEAGKSNFSSFRNLHKSGAEAEISAIRNNANYGIWAERFQETLGKEPSIPDVYKTLSAVEELDAMNLTPAQVLGAAVVFFAPDSYVMTKFQTCRTFHYFVANIDKFLPAQKSRVARKFDLTPKQAYYPIWDPRHPDYLESRDNAGLQKGWETSMKRPWVPQPDFEDVSGNQRG